jgi:ferritin-like metal-binding protein YciE
VKILKLEDVFLEGLKNMYDAERQLAEALPQIAESCTSPQLRAAIEQHHSETKEHASRAEEVFRQLGEQPESKPNQVIKQMLEMMWGILHAAASSPIRDAAIIAANNQIEHFEIAAYGSLASFAHLLGHEEAAGKLEKTLQEEKKADAKLTEIGEQHVNLQALHRSAAAASSQS